MRILSIAHLATEAMIKGYMIVEKFAVIESYS